MSGGKKFTTAELTATGIRPGTIVILGKRSIHSFRLQDSIAC
ncbi:hypothetical protein [Rubidibacter lacunae]|nr:hypothetical protein [Rubidibacter lacunae]